MLHIGLRALAARERGVQLGDAIRGKCLEFVDIDKILIGMTAAEEQHRRAQAFTHCPLRGALLQEAAKWREPGAGADHDDRHRGVVRQAEARLGFAQRRMDGLAGVAA